MAQEVCAITHSESTDASAGIPEPSKLSLALVAGTLAVALRYLREKPAAPFGVAIALVGALTALDSSCQGPC